MIFLEIMLTIISVLRFLSVLINFNIDSVLLCSKSKNLT